MLGEEHPDTLQSMTNLGRAIRDQGRDAEAEKLYREVLETQRCMLGEEHPDTLQSMTSLGRAIREQGRYKETEELYRELVEIYRRVRGAEDHVTLAHMYNLAVAIMKQGRYNEADRLFREVLEVRRRVLGDEHPRTRFSMNSLAGFYADRCWKLATAADVSERDPTKAVELANLAIELQPDSANNWNNLGVAQYRAGNWQAAVEALEKADAMTEGGDRFHRVFLAMAHWQLGDKEKARELYAQGAAWIAERRKNSEEQNRFRVEAEELMGLTEEDHRRLVEEYLARPADETAESPNEKPNEKPSDGEIDTGDQNLQKVGPEGQDDDP
jgi:tetratricopeptide (TPR) repeat protein